MVKKKGKKIQKNPEGQKVTAELCGFLLSIHNLAGAEKLAVVSSPRHWRGEACAVEWRPFHVLYCTPDTVNIL